MRHAAKVDRNQAEIVDALRKAGCSVMDLSQVGKGCPDLLVSYSKELHLIEVKNPKGKNKLNPLQVKWHTEWRGKTPAVVRSIEEALIAVGALKAVRK